jgi:radical SAM family uncharacterized protein/radical SAM-linked protein
MTLCDQKWFTTIIRPSRYIGNEVNARVKGFPPAEVSIALAFPDVYEVGMSHLGLKILYHLLNREPWISAERAFCPWVDLEKELRHRGIPLTSLESGQPLSDFDIIGFSLQHELSFTNVLNMLDLSGIPLLASERGPSDPLIIAGGPACFNPEPVADVFDLVVVGDGEEASLEICRVVKRAKKENMGDRNERLSLMKTIRGVYIPSLFSPRYLEGGEIRSIETLDKDCAIVRKAILTDIDACPFPDRPVIPFAEAVHDRLSVEISRGCTRGCRFCQAGVIYRPVRERQPESILAGIASALEQTGYDELSLLSLSSGDYSFIKPLLKSLMDRHSGEKISVSLPSLRVDSMDPAWIEQIKRVRKTGFTLAPEAGNDRMRRIINKGLTNDDIMKTAGIVFEAGWKLIKLYFMIGLPGETDSDVKDIVELAREISGIGGKKRNRNNLNVSISTYVPKSHTPFMWLKQIPLEESRRKIRIIREELKGPIRVKWNQPELSWLEGIFARGDRKLCGAVLRAFKLGARFDAWGEQFRMDIWQKAFDDQGIDPDFYLLRERGMDEVLPWDHISSGVNKGFLKEELNRSQKEILTPDCREKCLECGVCDHRVVDPVLAEGRIPVSSPTISERTPPERNMDVGMRVRIGFSKTGNARFLSHLELVKVFTRAFRRARLKLAYSKGYHPMPKVSFANALPVGTESMHETLELDLLEKSEPAILQERMNRQLPDGLRVSTVELRGVHEKKAKLVESHFRITFNGTPVNKSYIERFLNTDYFPIEKKGKKGTRKINARDLVDSMKFIPPNAVEMIIRHKAGPHLRPEEILKNIFSFSDEEARSMSILKTGQKLEG